ncbi:MAG: hypothetical protein IPJ30_14150 [Acidobacteria bacterium]|nr:hypothetical protein [Acidobacteriota bacterium]
MEEEIWVAVEQVEVGSNIDFIASRIGNTLTTMANRADDEYNEFEQNAIQAFLSWERIIKFKFNDNEPQRDSFVSKLMVCLFETVLETATGRLLDKPDIVEFRSKASTALANRQIRDALCREFEKT